jgi:hypothetical protein
MMNLASLRHDRDEDDPPETVGKMGIFSILGQV